MTDLWEVNWLCMDASSVLSRMVVTVPMLRPSRSEPAAASPRMVALRRFTARTLVAVVITRSSTSPCASSTAVRPGSMPTSSTGRPTTPGATPSRATALSLIMVITPSVSTAITPSRMLCSNASR